MSERPELGETRYDSYGKMRVMAVADGYVMARRPRAVPFVLSVAEWQRLPLTAEKGALFVKRGGGIMERADA